ncbi:MAG: hypothetical protein KF812_02010 [Fimbriimonadaceae bacterium]|nr:hypothetical protein [Fimbriimonadaceae bacterium]
MMLLMQALAVLVLLSGMAFDPPGSGATGQIVNVQPGNGPASVSIDVFKTTSPPRNERGPNPENENEMIDGVVVVEATSSVEVRYLDETVKKRWETCWNACRRIRDGNNNATSHPRHEVCDASCDNACSRDHNFTLTGEMDPLSTDSVGLPPELQMGINGGLRATEFGFAGLDWREMTRPIQEACASMEASLARPTSYKPGHTLLAPYVPCSQQLRIYGARKGELWATVSVRKVFSANGKSVELASSSTNYRVRTFRAPQPGPIENSPNYIYCMCHWTDTRPREWFRTGRQVGLSTPLVEHGDRVCVLPPAGKTETFATAGRPLTEFAGGQFAINCTGQNMNRANIQITNMSADPLRLFLPAGTILISDDSGVQNMVLAEDFAYQMSAESGTKSGPNLRQEAATVRVHCADISKKEPTSRTRFAILAAPSDEFAQAAWITAQSRFGGPWDQSRFWILSNQSTLAKVNDVIVPGVTASQYVANLYELTQSSAIDISKPEYARLIESGFLFEADPRPAPTHWLVQTLGNRDNLRIANPTSEQIQALISGDASGAATWIEACLASNLSAFRSAGLLLAMQVPEGKRDNVLKSGALGRLGDSLLSTDAGVNAAAMQVVNGYGLSDWLPEVNP